MATQADGASLDETTPGAPLAEDALASLEPAEPEVRIQQTRAVHLTSFQVPAGTEPRLLKDPNLRDTWRVEVDGPAFDLARPYERIPVVELDGDVLAQYSMAGDLDGSRPLDAPMTYQPAPSKPDQQQWAKRLEAGEDRPTNVFGDDERIVFNDSSYPWRTTGRILTENGACTGAVIGPRLVLTASHCINWIAGGGAGWVQFSPAFHNGDGPWGVYSATNLIAWNRAEGGLSDLETAFDYVVLVMDRRIGDDVGWLGYRTYSDDWNGLNVWQHVGYPADLTSSQRPSFQGGCRISTADDEGLAGQTGLVLGHFNDVTGGHSGGPVWGWWPDETFPRVVGVQSSEANTPAFNTGGDNEFGGGPALSALITWARDNNP